MGASLSGVICGVGSELQLTGGNVVHHEAGHVGSRVLL